MTKSGNERNPGPETRFPNAPAGWSVQTAIDLAEQENLVIGDSLWDVVKAIQEYSARQEDHGINVRELLDALDEKFHHAGGKRYLYKLLPGGPVAQGCRLAGVNPPAGSTDFGFGSVQ
jgi:tRNA 2-thiouridine synthesizing protein E